MTTPRPELELFAQIVSANVADATYITDQLLAAKDDEIQRLAKTIKTLGEILDQATVIDRVTEARLRRVDHEIEWAYHVLANQFAHI